MSGLQVVIPGLDVNPEKGYVNFRLLVSKGETSWQCLRRYKDFERLDASLRGARQLAALVGELPKLPAKQTIMRMGSSKFDPTFLEERRAGLEAYMAKVALLVPIEECEALDDFLLYAQYWLREALERLEGYSALEGVTKLLREALELVQGGGRGQQQGDRRGSDFGGEGEGEGGPGGGPLSPGGGAGSGGAGYGDADKALAALVERALRGLKEHLAELQGRVEDREARAQGIGSGAPILARDLSTLQEDCAEAKHACEMLIAARQKDCERERSALDKKAKEVRMVWAEAVRVERETRVFEGLALAHGPKGACGRLRGMEVLGQWENGGGAGPAQPPPSPTVPLQHTGTAQPGALLSRECAAMQDPSTHLKGVLGSVSAYLTSNEAFLASLLAQSQQQPPKSHQAPPPHPLPNFPALRRNGGGLVGGAAPRTFSSTASGGAAAAAAAGSALPASPVPPQLSAHLSGPDLAAAALCCAAAADVALLTAMAQRLHRGQLKRAQSSGSAAAGAPGSTGAGAVQALPLTNAPSGRRSPTGVGGGSSSTTTASVQRGQPPSPPAAASEEAAAAHGGGGAGNPFAAAPSFTASTAPKSKVGGNPFASAPAPKAGNPF